MGENLCAKSIMVTHWWTPHWNYRLIYSILKLDHLLFERYKWIYMNRHGHFPELLCNKVPEESTVWPWSARLPKVPRPVGHTPRRQQDDGPTTSPPPRSTESRRFPPPGWDPVTGWIGAKENRENRENLQETSRNHRKPSENSPVVSTYPFKKNGMSFGMMTLPTYEKIYNVPNHQPDIAKANQVMLLVFRTLHLNYV